MLEFLMRITLRLILSLVLGISVCVFFFSYIQTNTEKARLHSDLERRSGILAESLRESILYYLETNSKAKIIQIVKKFGNRERLKGIAVFDRNGELLALTPGFKIKEEILSDDVRNTINEMVPRGRVIKVDNRKLYFYTIPVLSETEDETVLGVLSIFQDATWIDLRIQGLWKENILRFMILALSVSIITVIIVRWSVTGPIAQIAEWVKILKSKGLRDGIEAIPRVRGDILLPLITEVKELARSFAIRQINGQEDRPILSDSFWTKENLREFIKQKLGDKKLFLLSNREPYMHIRDGKDIKCIVPPGGLVTALDPVMRACGGIWIAHGAGEADREVVSKDDKIAVPPQDPAYSLKRIWLTKDEEVGYYYGFSNEGLWPLCHITYVRPSFRLENWIEYQKVNQRFAETLLEEIKGEETPLVLVQDYHLALVPLLIKKKRPDAKIALFWHIPWPNPEVFGICPWGREILLGMLGADLIGFHIQFYCNNFLETVDRFLECKIDWEHFSVERRGHSSFVRPLPISVSVEDFSYNKQVDHFREMIYKEFGLEAQYVGVGVDRIDYTKGIPEKFLSIERFLDKYPDFVGKFTFFQFAAPSRTHIKQYREVIKESEDIAERINWKFGGRNYRPIVFLKGHHDHARIVPFYKGAHFCMVTSLHDGMNLVAKEFVASRNDNDGVLILSQFTGASRELKDSIIVNPYDIEGMADAIYQALTMEEDERRERMTRMRNLVSDHNIYWWTKKLIETLLIL